MKHVIPILQNEKIRRELDNIALKNSIAEAKTGYHTNIVHERRLECAEQIKYNDIIILELQIAIEFLKLQ